MRSIRFVRSVSIAALLFMALAGALFAQDAEPLVIAATADGVTVPENLVAGVTTLTLQNESEAPFAPILARFNEDKGMPDLMGAMQGGLAEGLAVVTVLGNPDLLPGDSYDVTYDLLAGDYVLIAFNQAGPPTILPFTVAENADADPEATREPIAADVVAQMGDFVFAVPSEIEAGAQTWQIENVGEQAHHLLVYAVEADVTLEDATAAFMDALMNATGGPPQMPYENVFTWGVMSPGERTYIELELEPGTYVIVCFLPDQTAEAAEDAMNHLEHGMIQLVTVGE
jgi:hypothetical protein